MGARMRCSAGEDASLCLLLAMVFDPDLPNDKLPGMLFTASTCLDSATSGEVESDRVHTAGKSRLVKVT